MKKAPPAAGLDRRGFLKTLGLGTAALTLPGLLSSCATSRAGRLPNFIVIFADDLGYGDLGSFGHPTLRTPHLDRMAADGAKLTQFYSASSVCTPSRAALLTGRLPIRSGMCSDRRRVLFPDSGGGLPHTEITIAEALKTKGYATACIGKWHLGHLPQFLPTRHGFDSYFGIPYSNDMDRVAEEGVDVFQDPKIEYFNVPLMRDEQIIERPTEQRTLTRRYNEEAVKFVKASKSRPFFLYLAHSLPHVPLFRSRDFEDISLRGLYGDVVEEIDEGVGSILDTLRQEGLAENTLVIFTSDNGPWLIFDEQGGSAGLLRGGKGSTWEGGMREPCVAWWPGKIEAGSVITDLTSTLDVLPTCLELAGVDLPADRVMDGVSMAPLLLGTGQGTRHVMFYYRGTRLYAVRQGPWKLHLITQDGYRDKPHPQDPPLLYHLEHDPSEKYDVAPNHPAVIADIMAEIERHRATVVPVPSQLEIPIGEAGA